MKHKSYKSKPSKRTIHITRQMHAVQLPREIDWRLFELRDGIDPDAPGRGVWVQTRTFDQAGVDAFIVDFRAQRGVSQGAPQGRMGARP